MGNQTPPPPPQYSSGPLLDCYYDFAMSDQFRQHPLQVRAAFQRVATWLPPREAAFPIKEINAAFARMLRDKAARERGWKFGNYALLLVQAISKVAVDAGALPNNRVKWVPKLPPPRRQSTERRYVKPARYQTRGSTEPRKSESA